MSQTEIYEQTLNVGRGNIEPAPHVERGEYSWELVERLQHDLLNDDSLYQAIEPNIPIQCADGRTRWLIGPSAIGGSFSAVIADALGPRKYYSNSDSAKNHAFKVYGRLQSLGFKIGGHDADHQAGDNCGCGGCDKLDSTNPNELTILGFLSDSGDEVRQVLEGLSDSLSGENLGISVDDSTHQTVINNARALHAKTGSDNTYVTNGTDLRDTLLDMQGKDAVETLIGDHKEAVLVLDLREGVALDREALAKRYGDKIQAFYVNVAALKYAADALYVDRAQAQLAFMSALYYNVAATAVLAGPSLRILTRT